MSPLIPREGAAAVWKGRIGAVLLLLLRLRTPVAVVTGPLIVVLTGGETQQTAGAPGPQALQPRNSAQNLPEPQQSPPGAQCHQLARSPRDFQRASELEKAPEATGIHARVTITHLLNFLLRCGYTNSSSWPSDIQTAPKHPPEKVSPTCLSEDHLQLFSLRRCVSNAGGTGGGPVNTQQHHLMSGGDAQRTTDAPNVIQPRRNSLIPVALLKRWAWWSYEQQVRARMCPSVSPVTRGWTDGRTDGLDSQLAPLR